MKLEHFLTPYIKMDKRLKCKSRNYKSLRGKYRQYTPWHTSQQDLYDPPPRVIEIKTKIIKWELIKLKRFCTAKEIIRLKDNPQNGRK